MNYLINALVLQFRKWECPNCSWLLLCFEWFSNLCLIQSTYTCLTTFLMKSIYTMILFLFECTSKHSINSLRNALVLIIGKWKCLLVSWLLLCFERFLNLCLMKSTYTFAWQHFGWNPLTTFLMKSIYAMLLNYC